MYIHQTDVINKHMEGNDVLGAFYEEMNELP